RRMRCASDAEERSATTSTGCSSSAGCARRNATRRSSAPPSAPGPQRVSLGLPLRATRRPTRDADRSRSAFRIEQAELQRRCHSRRQGQPRDQQAMQEVVDVLLAGPHQARDLVVLVQLLPPGTVLVVDEVVAAEVQNSSYQRAYFSSPVARNRA